MYMLAFQIEILRYSVDLQRLEAGKQLALCRVSDDICQYNILDLIDLRAFISNNNTPSKSISTTNTTLLCGWQLTNNTMITE
jgi:hypothetical protein